MKIATGNRMTPPNLSWAERCRLVKEAGFDGFEMWIGTPDFDMETTDDEIRALADAVHEAGLEVSSIASTLGSALSNLMWGRISVRRGNRQVIRLTILGQAAIPAYALALSVGFPGALRAAPEWAVTAAFMPIFLLIGGVLSGTYVGFASLLLDIAPEDRRPTYLGITNTTMGVASLFPALGGVLADLLYFQGVFVVSAAMVCAAFLLSHRLKEPE